MTESRGKSHGMSAVIRGKVQSSVGKKMAAVHFTQYHGSLTQPETYKESHIFAVHVHVLSTFCTLGSKVLERFCFFISVF